MMRKFNLKSQWSLIFFTLLIQLAVGSTVILSAINSQIFNKNVDSLPNEVSNRLIILVLASTFIAVMGSLFHLGSPQNAHFSINNLRSSWLSREILLVILFSITVFTYFIFERMALSNGQIRLIIVILSSIVGLALIISMSKLYMIGTIPAWNTLFTPAKFILTTAILGVVALMLILTSNGYSNMSIDGNNLLIKSILQILLLLIFAELLLFIVELWRLNSEVLAEYGSFKLITEDNRFTFFAQLFLFTLSILFILYKLLISSNQYSVIFSILISVLVILLQITQRFLFYASYNRIGV